MSTLAFEALARYIEEELAFMTSHYNDSYLRRRIASRMRRTAVESYEAYLALLRDDDEERTALLNALSINVTEFFRNPEVWDAITPLLADLTDGGRTVRAWSAATADGREAYSLAMLALDDPAIDASNLSVTATDINRQALATARRGVYESTRTVDIAGELSYLSDYTEYVDHSDGQYRIRRPVRELVGFERHDLIDGAPKPGCSLVLCRNLFIYIDPEYKTPVLRTVRDSLPTGGYLVIGKAESLEPTVKSAFEPVDEKNRIYRLTA